MKYEMLKDKIDRELMKKFIRKFDDTHNIYKTESLEDVV